MKEEEEEEELFVFQVLKLPTYLAPKQLDKKTDKKNGEAI